ncbi:MAG: PH domain-containing protein [Planctomycetales bacterium]|nr:PH domain-containing protein [Planctomycetales bacterium]
MVIPEKAILRASKWCYSGIWAFVTTWFRVPDAPPHLRGADDAQVRSFRPGEGFLRYLKLYFWIGLTLFDGMMFIAWIIMLITIPWIGLLLTIPIWAIMILPDIVAYIAIHLQYDTTWYVLSDRSMRIRRGIWTIHETTITYDNIQNVSIRQGPLQRYFAISDVLVETAGGGASTGKGEGASATGHSGLFEGIGNAEEVRSLILAKWRASRTSGLGDEMETLESKTTSTQLQAFDESHLALLEEIRDLTIHLAE